jgi:hypothetical protein
METEIGRFEGKRPSLLSQDRVFEVRVSSERLVGIHLGGQLASEGGGAMIAHHFGLLGVLVWHLFFKRRAEQRREEQAKLRDGRSLEDLALSDEKNFVVRFAEISAAELSKVRFSLHGAVVAELKVARVGEEPLRLLLRDVKQASACKAALQKALPDRLVADLGIM